MWPDCVATESAHPAFLDGPVNARCFLTWVEQSLAAALRPGDIFVMDNLGSDKGPAVS